jgi:hypothetical protein
MGGNGSAIVISESDMGVWVRVILADKLHLSPDSTIYSRKYYLIPFGTGPTAGLSPLEGLARGTPVG